MNQQPIGIIGAMKMEVDAILAAMEIASSLVPQPKCKVHLILGCNEEQ